MFGYFAKKVMIVRDPRDRALSETRFAFTPYMLRHYPHGQPEEASYLHAYFDQMLRHWSWQVGHYLLQQQALGLHLVFYENLKQDFAAEVRRLATYLGMNLPDATIEHLQAATSFSRMQKRNPHHVQQGSHGGWKRKLSEAQQAHAIERCGLVMQALGYPLHTPPSARLVAPSPAMLSRIHRQLEA